MTCAMRPTIFLFFLVRKERRCRARYQKEKERQTRAISEKVFTLFSRITDTVQLRSEVEQLSRAAVRGRLRLRSRRWRSVYLAACFLNVCETLFSAEIARDNTA